MKKIKKEIKDIKFLDKNIKLATYASRCIDNEILMYLRSTKKLGAEVYLEDTIGKDKDDNTVTLKEVLENNSFTLNHNNLLVESKVKWTHHFLTAEELTFLDNLKQQLRTINDICESKPGIVTAANNFFIIDKKQWKYFLLNVANLFPVWVVFLI